MTEKELKFEDRVITITIWLMLFIIVFGFGWIGYGIYLLL